MPVCLVGIPFSVFRLMLLSVPIYYGCRVVSPMPIFARRTLSKRAIFIVRSRPVVELSARSINRNGKDRAGKKGCRRRRPGCLVGGWF
jgi:hypothetical protein